MYLYKLDVRTLVLHYGVKLLRYDGVIIGMRASSSQDNPPALFFRAGGL